MKIKTITILSAFIALTLSAYGISPPEHGKIWNELPYEAKRYYVLGVIHGGSYALDRAAPQWLPKEDYHSIYSENRTDKVQLVFSQTAVKLQSEQLIEGMDFLYSDPANVHIGHIEILYFARDRALGKNITESIQRERKKALEDWEILMQHYKNKKDK